MLCQIRITIKIVEIEDNQCDYCFSCHSLIFLSMGSLFPNSIKKNKHLVVEAFWTSEVCHRLVTGEH